MVEDIRNLLGKISSPLLEKIVAAQKQAAPAESKAGKAARAPLDVRPAAARNKPKPKHSKFQKKAGHNPPLPEFASRPSLRELGSEQLREKMGSTKVPFTGPGGMTAGRQEWYWRPEGKPQQPLSRVPAGSTASTAPSVFTAEEDRKIQQEKESLGKEQRYRPDRQTITVGRK
jgi:hypothetical protein